MLFINKQIQLKWGNFKIGLAVFMTQSNDATQIKML